jgi:Ulp1 family protease
MNIWGNSASSASATALVVENNAAVVPPAHHHLPVTIRRSDINLLESGGLLNDTLVDFFLQWYVHTGHLFLSQ